MPLRGAQARRGGQIPAPQGLRDFAASAAAMRTEGPGKIPVAGI